MHLRLLVVHWRCWSLSSFFQSSAPHENYLALEFRQRGEWGLLLQHEGLLHVLRHWTWQNQNRGLLHWTEHLLIADQLYSSHRQLRRHLLRIHQSHSFDSFHHQLLNCWSKHYQRSSWCCQYLCHWGCPGSCSVAPRSPCFASLFVFGFVMSCW